ncbi:sugar transferase [Paracoccus sp. T5]|uniref:sugar transferase n=1 Tax=Paracoccus sp. T5 TaxID=3402161 RepID=UPI003AE9A8E8
MSRWIELPLVAILYVLTLPIQIGAAITIRLILGPPLLFRQDRVGQDGKTITLCKMRTMNDRRGADGALLPDGMRVTPFTRLVRRLRLDELPQLWMILRGDMALVGPRPLLPATLAQFGALGRMRNSVRPGLTGWAQVSGNTRLDDREKLALDLWYVAHRSAILDGRILLETAATALFGERRDEPRVHQALDWFTRGLLAQPREAS